MLPHQCGTQVGDVCNINKSHSYNGFEEEKNGPSLSCENSRPSSIQAHYAVDCVDDLNNNQINKRFTNQFDNEPQFKSRTLDDHRKNGHSNERINDRQIAEQTSELNNQMNNRITKLNDHVEDQLSAHQSADQQTNIEMSDVSNQTRTSNEELSNTDNLTSNPNESSTNDEDSETRNNLNVPNYLLLADEQSKHSTLYFAPSHGVQHTALGLPKLINTFNDENLEFAYQLYSMRQRHQPLMIINFLNFLLTFVFIGLPIFLMHKERMELVHQSAYTLELLRLIAIGITLNLHLILPSIVLLLITILWKHCANHRLHYVGYTTFAITIFLTQLIEKGQLHLNNGRIDFLLIDRFDNGPIHTVEQALSNSLSSLNASLSSANLIKNTTNLFLRQNTWYLMYTVFITYVILPLSLKWSTICSFSVFFLDLFLTIFTAQHEHANCTQSSNLKSVQVCNLLLLVFFFLMNIYQINIYKIV